MNFIKQAARRYWIIYYLVYTGGVAYSIPSYWRRLSDDGGLLWLAAIYGVSAGTALLAAIYLEALGRMVLLIPAAIKHYKEQGLEQGLEQGREEGRREERRRIEEELRRAAEPRPEPVAIPEGSLREAREIGRREGREAERQRIIAAFIAQGERDADGTLRVTLPPEVVKILFDESDQPTGMA